MSRATLAWEAPGDRARRWLPAITPALLALASACSGGGGGYGAMSPAPMTAAPTVKFTAPASPVSIALGQGLMLSWTSADTTSCTAGAASGAGPYTGMQAAAGSALVVPTAPGTYTYQLTCLGGGGEMTARSATVTVQPSILSGLGATAPAAVGFTVDPLNGDQNPYGLVLATAAVGPIAAGDLIVCNFNNGNSGPMPNTQGQGTTLVGLHPQAGTTPYRIAQSASLLGCNALAALADGSIAASAWSANQAPLVNGTGSVATPFASDTFENPWGVAYVAAAATHGAALYFTNVPGGAANAKGSLVRIDLDDDAQTSFTLIASGFCTSGAPGGIFGPAGLTYDASIDTLYIVDTSSASVIALANVSSIGPDGVTVNGQCATTTPTPVPTFTGAAAGSVRVIAHGPPFNTPLSAALLGDGDLLVANADIGLSTPSSTTNLLIEVSPVLPGGFVGKPLQVDAGTPGALFGLAATVDGAGAQIVYFNDDNANAVMSLHASTGSPAGQY